MFAPVIEKTLEILTTGAVICLTSTYQLLFQLISDSLLNGFSMPHIRCGSDIYCQWFEVI